jgi:hypothetical protein
MLEFLIDNIFVTFDGRVFQQTDDMPIGTSCPLIFDLFLYSCGGFSWNTIRNYTDPLISSSAI